MKKPPVTIALLICAGFAITFMAGSAFTIALIVLAIGAVLMVLALANRPTDGDNAERNRANRRRFNRALTNGLVCLIIGGVVLGLGEQGLTTFGASLMVLGVLAWIPVTFFGSPSGS